MDITPFGLPAVLKRDAGGACSSAHPAVLHGQCQSRGDAKGNPHRIEFAMVPLQRWRARRVDPAQKTPRQAGKFCMFA
jgi:hypothetical protein